MINENGEIVVKLSKEEMESFVKGITSDMVEIEGKDLMGTQAYHMLGDISRDEPDLFFARYETEKYWVGSWVTGFGFFNVCFPKSTSRELTDEEIDYYNEKEFRINSQPPFKLNIPKK